MKLNSIVFLCLIAIFSISATSSNPPKWSKADIKQFNEECLGVKEIQDLGKLGVQLCDCILDKSQKQYPSYANANMDGEGMKKIGEACATEVTNTTLAPSKGASKKGKWSKEDKTTFLKDCNGVKEIKDLGKLGEELCDCMLKKSEQAFNSFDQADHDEKGMEAIGLECADEVVKKMTK
jgi:hypothetical protein